MVRARARRGRASKARKGQALRVALEGLEARQLLATIPAPAVVGRSNLSPTGTGVNESSPSIAINPNNPNQLVSVWTEFDTNPTTPVTRARGAFSLNGGATWTSFDPLGGNPVFLDPTTNNPAIPFTRVLDTSVAFDRNGSFYVAGRQTNVAGNVGTVFLTKFNASGGTPAILGGVRPLYSWNGAPTAIAQQVTLAVDDNPATFTDPDTGAVQSDPFSGNVYVAWATLDLDTNVANPDQLAPQAIYAVGSSDGGNSFTAPRLISTSGFNRTTPAVVTGLVGHRTPRLVVGGATPGGGPGGQVYFTWDDFATGTGGNEAKNAFDVIRADRTQGVVNQRFVGPGGTIPDATDPGGGAAHTTATQLYPLNIGGFDPRFTTIGDLDVEIKITHPVIAELQVRLLPPVGSGLAPILLLANGTDAGGAAVVPANGAAGTALGGAPIVPGGLDSVIFDAQATSSVVGTTSPRGYYRPSNGSILATVSGLTPAQLTGTWQLEITDFRATANGPPAPVENLDSWALRFSSGLVGGTDVAVTTATMYVGNALGGPVTSLATPINPAVAPVIARDNTLGSFSPNQGRLYIAFTDRIRFDGIAAGGGANPDDNTDIFLAVSADGGQTWTRRLVNDDDSRLDGFSEAAIGAGFRTGRPQFQPNIAVDQTTGTLVMSWLDTRDDAARARVATYMTSSIDGGLTFSPQAQAFANRPVAPLDVATGQTVTLAPIPDNESAGNSLGARETTFGFGTRQGLAVHGGRVYPAWASNENGGNDGKATLDIRVVRATIAAGPRVVEGTMGPVGEGGVGPRALDGAPLARSLVVVFDRPVNPASFTAADIQLRALDANGNPLPAALQPVVDAVGGIVPLDGGPFGATRFQVNFRPQNGSSESIPGTISYVVGPGVSDRIRTTSVVVAPNNDPATFTPDAANRNLPLPPSGLGGSGNPALDAAVSQIDVTGFPLGSVVDNVTVNVQIDYPFSGDLVLTLIAPDNTQVVLAQYHPVFGGGGGTGSFPNTTFDDSATTPIGATPDPFLGTFRPLNPLAALRGAAINGTWRLVVSDDFALDVGTLLTWSLTVSSGTLIPGGRPGNTMDQDADAVAAEALNDVFDAPRRQDPNGPLFTAPFVRDTLGLVIPGPHIVGPLGNDLSLNTTVSSIDVTFDRLMQIGQFTADDVLRITGPAGPLGQPLRFASTDVNRATADGQTLVSSLVINHVGSFIIDDLDVRLDIDHARVGDLTAVLVYHPGQPDERRITLVANRGGNGANFVGTNFDDEASRAISQGTAPFTGSFRPESPLSVLDDLQLAGAWALEVTDAAGAAVGTLRAWSLTATPRLERGLAAGPGVDIWVEALNPVGNNASTFRVHFPEQRLSGTYTLELGSEIFSARGDAMDKDLDAGVDALRGVGDMLQDRAFDSAQVPVIIEVARDVTTPTVVTSTLQVTEAFVIQDVNLQLDITFANDPDLEAYLVAPDGTTRIRLFAGVGDTGSRQDFDGTIFDDGNQFGQDANFLPIPRIDDGGPPFSGRHRPLGGTGTAFGNRPFAGTLRTLDGRLSAGTYTLEIVNKSPTLTGTLNSWSLTFQKVIPDDGLGEEAADRTPVSFRIFTMDPTNELASSTWTPLGPASINNGGASSRIGGIAVDPSDPSGNTVYLAGASGGIWKTFNFLTTSGQPTWIPLTDFGPSFSLNIGNIAVFGRNNDPSQSILFVTTGEGDTNTPGAGILRSMDGGATWTVLDSTNNALPFNQRDHALAGQTSFAIAVDPQIGPSGVIVYAALGDGVWRSEDSGQHWQRVLNGRATDIVLDPFSGTFNAQSNPNGNLQVIYAAIQDVGVFRSPSQGRLGSWTLINGGIGNPLIRDNDFPGTPKPAVPTNNLGVNPNGNNGRILLAKPALVPDTEPDSQRKNLVYQGWLYAAVATDNGATVNLYVTKDRGDTWTRVEINNQSLGLPGAGGPRPVNPVVIPSNNATLPESIMNTQGNYNISFTIDPNDPNVVYIGTRAAPGVTRVDITGLHDPTAFYLDSRLADGGALLRNTAGAVQLKPDTPRFDAPTGLGLDPRINPHLNLLRNPADPLGASPTVLVSATQSIANTGVGARWIPFDFSIGGGDHHRIVAMRDPVTGHTRLIYGYDQGVATAVDAGGFTTGGIGTATSVNGLRNGNLQINQFYYGAIQPSSLGIDPDGDGPQPPAPYPFLLVGGTQDNGAPASSAGVLDTGNLSWGTTSGGDGGGTATDQQGRGTLYQYFWPAAGGGPTFTEFFRVNGVGRTTGLIDPSDPTRWPDLSGSGNNIAVNPLNGDQVLISSFNGRLFRTQDQALTWLEITRKNPDGTFNPFPGGAIRAIAYGAPDPAITGSATDDFIYVGTGTGQVFVTTNGGATWTEISGIVGGGATLAGRVMAIVTNPARGSHEAYAVTTNGVYHIPNSLAPGVQWRDITGAGANSIFQVKHEIFGNPDFVENRLKPGQIKALQVDWRYVLPDDRTNPDIYINPPANPGDESITSPLLFVGGEGGVFRSTDNGRTWRSFPTAEANNLSTTPTPPGNGGGLPNADVRDLDLSLGKIDPVTGRAVAAPGDPNMLVAFTYGRGAFGIRLAPVVLPELLALDPKNPNLRVLSPASDIPDGGSDSGNDDGATVPLTFKDRVTNVISPYIAGYSEQSAFGVSVHVTLYDLTDPLNPVYVGGWDPANPATTDGLGLTDSVGRFVHRDANGNLLPGIKVLAGAPGSGIARFPDGKVRLGVQATDQSGTEGPIAVFEYTLDTTIPGAPRPIDLDDFTDSAAVPQPTGTALASGFGAGTALMTDETDAPLVHPGADATPVAADVGKTLEITGGAGWTVGSYTITAVVGDAWQLDRAPAATHAMDGAWRLLDATLVRPGAAYTPVASDIGRPLRITGGAGWTVGSYTITRIVGNAWQLDRTPAPAGTTGGSWVLILSENIDDRTSFNNDPSPADAPLFHVGGPSNRVETGATVVLTRALIDPNTGLPGAPLIVNRRVNVTPDANGVVDILDVNTGYGDVTAAIFEDGVLVPGSAVRVITATPTPRGRIADGVYLYRAFQIDAAGNIGPLGNGLTVTIDATAPVFPPIPPPDQPTLDLIDEDDTGRPRTPDAIQRDQDEITFVVRPNFQGFVEPSAFVELFINGQPAGSTRADATTGYYKVSATINLTEGANNVTVRQTDIAGNVSLMSDPLPVTLDTEQPGAINPDLTAPSDTGPSPMDDITADNTPTFINRTLNGQPELAEPFALVQIYAQRVAAEGEPTAPLELVGEGLADATGRYAVTVGQYVQPTPPVTVPNLADGQYQITALQYDIAGNPGRQLSFGATGTIIIDGTDANDHGSFDGTQNRDGWAYIEKALNNIAPNVENGNKTLLVLGAAAPTSTFEAGEAVRSAFALSNLPAAGWSIVHVDGKDNIDQLLSGLPVTGQRRQGNGVVNVPNVRLDDAGILYITTANNAFEDLDTEELRVLNRHGVDIANYVNGGGGLFSHSETSFDEQVPAYGWLTSIFPNLVVRDEAGFGGAVEITTAGMMAFPGLTPADLSTGPWHNWFDGDLGLLSVLATDLNFENARVPLILTSIGVSIQPLTVTIDTTLPVLTAPDLQPLSDSPQPAQPGYVAGVTDTDNTTNVTNPTFDITGVEPGGELELYRDDVRIAVLSNVTPSGPNRVVAVQDPGPVAAGVHRYKARQTDRAGNVGSFTAELLVTSDFNAPDAPAAPDLQTASDTPTPPHPGYVAGGTDTDNITADDSPTFDIVGVEPRATLQLLRDGVVVATLVDVAGGTVAITDPDAPDGSHTYRAQQFDRAGNLSPLGDTLMTIVDTAPPAVLVAPDLQTASDGPPPGQPGYIGGVTDVDNITADNSPTFDVPNVEDRATLQLLRDGVVVATLVDVAGGTVAITDPNVPDGVHVYQVQQYDLAGNLSPLSAGLTVTIDTTAPGAAPTLRLLEDDDTGPRGDNTTARRRPAFEGQATTGTVEAGTVVEIVRAGTNEVLARTTMVDSATGAYSDLQLASNLVNGRIDLQARYLDAAGNTSGRSATLTLTVISVADDFDGDGKSDPVTWRPASGLWSIVPSSTGVRRFELLGQAGDIPVRGDFDGDGRADIGIYRPATGQFTIIRSRDGKQEQLLGNGATSLPVTADYDGDGRTDLAVFDTSTAVWTVLRSTQGLTSFQFGRPGGTDIPLVGDFNGDGRADVGLFWSEPALVLAANTGANGALGGGFRQFRQFGRPGGTDIPLVGDFNGDGRSDVGLFWPEPALMLYGFTGTDGTFVTGGGVVRQFGRPGGTDVPVPGDYDDADDGRTDTAIYWPETGQFLISYSGGGSLVTVPGAPRDLPLQAPVKYLKANSRIGSSSAVTTAAVAPAAATTSSSLNFGQTAAALSVATPTAAVQAQAASSSTKVVAKQGAAKRRAGLGLAAFRRYLAQHRADRRNGR